MAPPNSVSPHLPSIATDQISLNRKISRSLLILFVIIIIVVSLYAFQFRSHPLSANADTWGQFGSYVGGLLSPLVSLAAFYWVMQSVQLQQKQLTETRDALEKAETAQQMQASHAQTSVRLSALTALGQAITDHIQINNFEIKHLVDQLQNGIATKLGLNNVPMTKQQITERVNELNIIVAENKATNADIKAQIEKILTATN